MCYNSLTTVRKKRYIGTSTVQGSIETWLLDWFSILWLWSFCSLIQFHCDFKFFISIVLSYSIVHYHKKCITHSLTCHPVHAITCGPSCTMRAANMSFYYDIVLTTLWCLPPFEADLDLFSLSLPFCSMFTEGGKSILSDWRLSSTVSLVACKACTQCDPRKDEMSTSLTCCIIRKKRTIYEWWGNSL